MTLSHAIMLFGANLETGFRKIFELALPCFTVAPVFVVCMGVGIAYSRNNTPKAIALRGVNLLLIGYILNILRATPLALSFLLRGVLLERLGEVTDYLVVIDIFQFAGIALIFFWYPSVFQTARYFNIYC